MPKKTPPPYSSKAEYGNAILSAIWDNKPDVLRQLLQYFDPNTMSNVPVISIAKMLKRTQCVELLRENGADETYAKHYDRVKLYGLFCEKDTNITLSRKLANENKKKIKMDKTNIYPSYASFLIKKALKSYRKKHANVKIDATIDMLDFSSKNFFYNHSIYYNQDAFYSRIKKGKPTFINSGWRGEEYNHVIGVVFYQNCMIVGDGLKNAVKIYRFDQKKLKKADLEALLTGTQGSKAHEQLIKRIANSKPPISIKVKTQAHLNCTVFSPLSALEGLWYVQEMSQGSSNKTAVSRARQERENFNCFVQNKVKKRIKKLKQKDGVEVAKRSKSNSSYYGKANWAGLIFAGITYFSLAMVMGVVINNLIIMSVLGSYACAFIGSQLREKYIHSQTKKLKDNFKNKHLNTSQRSALKAGIKANKSYLSQFKSWANSATYQNPSYYYLGLGLKKSQISSAVRKCKRISP